MCSPSQAFACSAGSSECPVGAVGTRRAVVRESAVANKVTSTPRFTRPSVKREANCSQGPYSRGGTRHEIGARIATRKASSDWGGDDIRQRGYLAAVGAWGQLGWLEPAFLLLHRV